ncbi:SDR family oxidoreductase [uncultured Ruegeria sp.]|uniref:SDR family NAD(P)-dependent oxidoreductase n=1 Tax=uncultured Ruegeria sp. TaxID=259304 RepID=UPI00262A9787|nr:SDR family oxidoreductase [uncultured Ruegeria sp.]
MRRVLVTGGGTGLGLAVAKAFSDAGDAVTITGRRADVLETAAQGRPISCRTADVTREEDVAALFETPFDVVVANAGGGGSSKLANTSLAEWNATLLVNMTGTFLTFREALTTMPDGGRLIAMASTASLQGNAAIPAYTAAKHGVLGLVRSVAQDVARRGITCNAVCPGFADTDLADTAIKGLMSRFGMDRDAATQKVVSGNPQGRLIDPSEVAGTVMFLASQAAASINGHALAISGGEV